MTTFSDIAERYIENLGYEPYHCSTEQEARERSSELIASKRWPCYFFKSYTTGEKDFEDLRRVTTFKNAPSVQGLAFAAAPYP